MIDDKYQYADEQRELELCKFDDDLPHFTEAELHDNRDSHEWYYFDLQTKDGEELIVRYIIKDTCVHDTNPSISPELTTNKTKTKEIERIKDYHRNDYKMEKMENEEGVIIIIGTNLIKIYRDHENNIKKYILILKFDEFEINLECIPKHQGFKLYKNSSYINKKANDDAYVCVVFPAPRMKIKGKLIIDQKEKEIEGEGYHDHTWGTTSLVYSHKEWHWGRIYTDEFTAFFSEVIPSANFSGKLKFLYYAKVGSTRPKLESQLTITPNKWKLKFMFALPIIFKYPLELSVTNLKRTVSVKTRCIEVLKFIKVYIRLKVDADFIENVKFKGVGLVEYTKIPFLVPRRMLMWSAKKKYRKWRKK